MRFARCLFGNRDRYGSDGSRTAVDHDQADGGGILVQLESLGNDDPSIERLVAVLRREVKVERHHWAQDGLRPGIRMAKVTRSCPRYESPWWTRTKSCASMRASNLALRPLSGKSSGGEADLGGIEARGEG